MANIYLTESSLLLDDKIKRLLQQDGRKEKILQVFFTKGETITYDQVETISLAGQKMQVNTIEIASKDDMLIRLGYLMGSTRKSNDTVYAFFEDGAIMQFLKNYGIEALDDALQEKKRSSAGRKKKSTHCSRRNSSHLSVTKATKSIPLWNTQLSICISSRTKMVHHTNCLVFARTSECIINHLQ